MSHGSAQPFNNLASLVAAKKGILFDLFHTLTSIEPMRSTGPATCDILGVSKEAWNDQLFENSRTRLTGEETDPFIIMEGMAHAIDPSIPTEVIREATISRIKKFEAGIVNIPEETVAAIRELKTDGKRIGLISNADVTEIATWDKSPISSLFDTAVFSCHVGCIKPEKEIYQICTRLLHLKPEDCLFVGDGGSRELEGARNFGMNTVMVTRVIEEIWPDQIEDRAKHADFVIQTIPDLLQSASSP